MSEYTISQVYPTDKTVLAQIDTLLDQEGIRRDGNLDYICAMFDEEYNVIGTGSCFGNTLRCFAVSSAHQGEGLLNQIITHLIEVQCARGNMHLFLYTKVKKLQVFRRPRLLRDRPGGGYPCLYGEPPRRFRGLSAQSGKDQNRGQKCGPRHEREPFYPRSSVSCGKSRCRLRHAPPVRGQ